MIGCCSVLPFSIWSPHFWTTTHRFPSDPSIILQAIPWSFMRSLFFEETWKLFSTFPRSKPQPTLPFPCLDRCSPSNFYRVIRFLNDHAKQTHKIAALSPPNRWQCCQPNRWQCCQPNRRQCCQPKKTSITKQSRRIVHADSAYCFVIRFSLRRIFRSLMLWSSSAQDHSFTARKQAVATVGEM